MNDSMDCVIEAVPSSNGTEKATEVYVAMAADILHPGHINILTEASKWGEVTVGLLTDKAISCYKRTPYMSFEQRQCLLESLGLVSHIVVQETLDYEPNLRKLRPAYLVHGDDWRTGIQCAVRQRAMDVLQEWGGKLIEVPYTLNPLSRVSHATSAVYKPGPGRQSNSGAADNRMLTSRTYYTLLAITLLSLIPPIWIVRYPGLVDYFNHLTRCYIIAHYYDNPIWQQRYLLIHAPIPNLAMELIVVPLTHFFPLEVSGKIFLTISALLYGLGCSALGKAILGKPNFLALVAALTFYNSAFLYGFVNYIFGVAIFLCAFAVWLRVHKTMSVLSFALCGALGILTFLSHLAGFALLAVACLTVALSEFVRDRKIASLLAKTGWLASSMLLMAAFMKAGGRVGTIEWSTPKEKLIFLFAPVRSYSMVADIALVLILLVCALVILKKSTVHPAAMVGLVFFVLLLISPKVLFTSSGADSRFAIPMYLLLLLSIEPRWTKWQKSALLVAFCAMVLRLGLITNTWREISHRSEQALTIGRVLPDGARIRVIPPTSDIPKLDRSLPDVSTLWTISHQADISPLFAIPGQQPLVFRQAPCPLIEGVRCFTKYDYIWTYDPPPGLWREISSIASPAAAWQGITLWRVDRARYE